MSDDRLPTSLWVDAHLRRLDLEAIPYYVVNKGAPSSGTVMVKINGLGNGCILLQQQRDFDGEMGWMKMLDGEEEKQIDVHIRRCLDRDPDLWVIEVEDSKLENPFEGKIF